MIAALLKGIALGFMLSITVGPVIFAIIKQSINNGYKGGFAFVAGVSASDIALVLISQIFTELFTDLIEYKNFSKRLLRKQRRRENTKNCNRQKSFHTLHFTNFCKLMDYVGRKAK